MSLFCPASFREERGAFRIMEKEDALLPVEILMMIFDEVALSAPEECLNLTDVCQWMEYRYGPEGPVATMGASQAVARLPVMAQRRVTTLSLSPIELWFWCTRLKPCVPGAVVAVDAYYDNFVSVEKDPRGVWTQSFAAYQNIGWTHDKESVTHWQAPWEGLTGYVVTYYTCHGIPIVTDIQMRVEPLMGVSFNRATGQVLFLQDGNERDAANR